MFRIEFKKTGENGEFAAIVKEDGTFNLMYHNDPGALEFLANFVKEGVVIATDDAFSTAGSLNDD